MDVLTLQKIRTVIGENVNEKAKQRCLFFSVKRTEASSQVKASTVCTQYNIE